jgi:hypothetical protein
MLVNVVAQILDEFRNQMSAGRSMFAAFNLHSGQSVVAGIRAYAGQRFTLKHQN